MNTRKVVQIRKLSGFLTVLSFTLSPQEFSEIVLRRDNESCCVNDTWSPSLCISYKYCFYSLIRASMVRIFPMQHPKKKKKKRKNQVLTGAQVAQISLAENKT